MRPFVIPAQAGICIYGEGTEEAINIMSIINLT